MSLVTDYLEARGIPYEVLRHGWSVVALGETRRARVGADHVLKAVMVDARGRRAVAVVPATRRLDMGLVRAALGDPSARPATEQDLQADSASFELGEILVLGWLLAAETLVDPSVLDHEAVDFPGRTRTDCVRVRTIDLFRADHASFVSLVTDTGTIEGGDR